MGTRLTRRLLAPTSFLYKPVITEWGGVDVMGPWLCPRPVNALLLSQRILGALSPTGDLSALRPAIVQTSYTGAFTMMLMTIFACTPTAAVVKTWIFPRDGSGPSWSCVGGVSWFKSA